MKNVAKKILAVMAAVESVEKDKKNLHHNYEYVSDEAIVSAIRKAMIENQLILVPNQKSCETIEKITKLAVEYTLADAESGETIVSTVYGYGHDTLDKGVYKAATGAEKYYLLKTFLIPTADDPERDNGFQKYPKHPMKEETPMDAIEPGQGEKPSWPHPSETPEPSHFPKAPPRVQKPGCISVKQAGRLYAIAKSAGKEDSDIKMFLKLRGYDSSMDIPWKEYEAICEEIAK